MDSTALAAALALTAGLLGAVQVAVMGRLGERIGSLEAVLHRGDRDRAHHRPVTPRRAPRGRRSGETLSQPWWMLTGGALGAAIVLSITIAGPRIGTTAVVGLLIAGQLVAATVDRPVWLVRLRPRRARLAACRSGIVLLAAGAALTLKR